MKLTEDLQPSCEKFLEIWLSDDENAIDDTSPSPGILDSGEKATETGAETTAPSDESSLTADEVSFAREHLRECPNCAREAELLAQDREALLLHFATIPVPTPVSLEPRGPLQSASGHPRRVSLTVLPTFFWLLLMVLVAVGALGWAVQRVLNGQQ